MEDIFRVLSWLEDRCDALEKQLAQRKGGAGAIKTAAKKAGAKKRGAKPAKKPAKRR
jgi:hypothetical protein